MSATTTTRGDRALGVSITTTRYGNGDYVIVGFKKLGPGWTSRWGRDAS